MSAGRKAIRHAAVALMKAEVAALGGRAYGNRAEPLSDQSTMPVCLVYTTSESVEVEGSPREYRRKTELVFEVVTRSTAVAENANLDDELDDLAAAVEQAVFRDEELLGSACDTILQRVEGPEMESDGRQLVGAVRVVFEAQYVEDPYTSKTYDAFEGVNVTYDVGPEPDGNPEATDTIELEQ